MFLLVAFLVHPGTARMRVSGSDMHGIVFRGMKHHVVDTHGRETWDQVQEDAGVGPKVYLPVETYTDEEFFLLAQSAAKRTNQEPAEFLESLGRSMAAELVGTYGDVVPNEWDVLETIANAEETIHTTLRARNPDLEPPELVCRRDSAEQVTVFYASDRQLCPVARGIVRGLANRYGESVTISEPRCMHHGDDHCKIVVSTP